MGVNIPEISGYDLSDYRDNPAVINIFKQLKKEGTEVNGYGSDLELVEFDETKVTDWRIEDYGSLYWL